VTVFYLTTNAALFGVRPWRLLALGNVPLATATSVVLSSNSTLATVRGAIVGAGALISVTGSNEWRMMEASRLGYVLAANDLVPQIFAKTHPRI